MRAKSPGWISLTEGVEKEGQKSLSRWKPRLQGRSATSHTTDKAARSVWTRRLPRLHPLAYKTKQIRAPKWLADDHAGEAQEKPSIFSKGWEVQASTSGNTSLSGCRRWSLNETRTGLLALVSYSQFTGIFLDAIF